MLVLSWRERVSVSKIEEIVDSGVEGLTIRDLIEARAFGDTVSSLEFVERLREWLLVLGTCGSSIEVIR